VPPLCLPRSSGTMSGAAGRRLFHLLSFHRLCSGISAVLMGYSGTRRRVSEHGPGGIKIRSGYFWACNSRVGMPGGKPSDYGRDFAGGAVQSERIITGYEMWQSVPSAATISVV